MILLYNGLHYNDNAEVATAFQDSGSLVSANIYKATTSVDASHRSPPRETVAKVER